MADDVEDVSKVTKVSEVSNGGESDVVEGEVISDDSENTDKAERPEVLDDGKAGAETTDAEMVMRLEGMIKNNNSQIAKIAADLTEAREMLKDAFENDATYHEHADAAKDANKIKAATKAQILKQPNVSQIATNVKVLTSELKELKEALSDYLGEYNRLSGITEIEGEDGELLQIVYVAKLVRKQR